jgi:hypothetical protein
MNWINYYLKNEKSIENSAPLDPLILKEREIDNSKFDFM